MGATGAKCIVSFPMQRERELLRALEKKKIAPKEKIQFALQKGRKQLLAEPFAL